MSTITTGRPLDEDGTPTDGPALQLDPDGPAADLLRESSRPLASSPGAGLWATILSYPDDDATPPELLLFLAPDALELPSHVHPDDPETFRAVEGEFTLVVEGEPQRLAPGESYTVDPGQEHGFRNDTDGFVAVHATLPWTLTIDTQYTFFGLDHEGQFGDDGEYGEPGFLHGMVMSEAISDGTKIAGLPTAVQRLLWATVGRVAKARGHAAVDERYLRDEFWRANVEQPDL
ncbi:cupin domain-containing protein [Halostella salina]|uniref:cupin domain-containing protein n=1 Tax=Halostella salina TaxID=1547897 RepID=UPI000EF78AF0|nr:cupin domain-containing protein [Halostella salina]